jgi:hypothetical protein
MNRGRNGNAKVLRSTVVNTPQSTPGGGGETTMVKTKRTDEKKRGVTARVHDDTTKYYPTPSR